MNTNIKNSIGDHAEFMFDACAVIEGIVVNRPIHAGTVYDRVVEYNGKFTKVQIKSVSKPIRNNSYRVILVRDASRLLLKDRMYSVDDVDVFAVYLMPEKDWYIFKNDGQTSITFNGTNHLQHKNNWGIFKCSKGS